MLWSKLVSRKEMVMSNLASEIIRIALKQASTLLDAWITVPVGRRNLI